MKTKRIVSLLLCLMMALSLLPAAALAVTEITTITVTIDEPVPGQPLPTNAVIAEDCFRVTKVEWTEGTFKEELTDTVHVYLEIKPGADVKFPKNGLTATINGQSAAKYYSEKGTTAEVAYHFSRHESIYPSTMPPANPVDVNYDTFDYRAYANIYPDVKAAYGYDAQKLWAHYVNYGKAEGRVAFAISASNNPKSGATIYKNAAEGTGFTSYDPHGPATVPATYLDTLPPGSISQSYDPWRLKQLTHYYDMSNAKLVAEYYSIMDVIDNKKTGFNYDLVYMNRRSELDGELGFRAREFEKVYCYENGIRTIDGIMVPDKDYQEAKASIEYERAAQSDGIILLHWMYSYDRREGKITFPTPPANPGTAGSAPAPAKPAGPAVTLTKQNLTVNGAAKNTEIYNIDGSNYFKLRDMAALLNGTGSQFSVDFDSARSTIVVKTGATYTAVGGELATGTDKSSTAAASAQSIEIDGRKADLAAYNIGGNNFFKLRDLGTALGFDVDYDGATSTMIVRSK